MRTFLARYAQAVDRFSVFIGLSCSTLLFACIAISAAEVALRYGFDAPTLWSTELAMTLCATAWILSVGYVTERRRHISITMLELLVGERVWRMFRLMQMIVALGAVFFLAVALWHPAMKALARAEHSGTAMNSIQPSYFKVMMVVGCVLYLIQLSANVIRWAQNSDGGRSDGH